ncbi:entericidin A/B family lipoprotein [Donghicola sp. C2-DW-16]|uniref:Entericidin A/B family lipoprotein n=1 Tax=Donghicola mangrovi TaxID=2729614 RepID=A0A850QEP5_9RHOB|nr:entericidin A/B family lipoprotein [Donghicola mangrovi]NVO24609.1 entericidin A/B family lipoprotein [Donghicola mangrovi]NVO28838.1 entericidin A/B family lipoprotein [Donghicola mangrovi]
MFKSNYVLASFLVIFGLAACETIEGAGRDIEHTGEAITNASQEAQ